MDYIENYNRCIKRQVKNKQLHQKTGSNFCCSALQGYIIFTAKIQQEKYTVNEKCTSFQLPQNINSYYLRNLANKPINPICFVRNGGYNKNIRRMDPSDWEEHGSLLSVFTHAYEHVFWPHGRRPCIVYPNLLCDF